MTYFNLKVTKQFSNIVFLDIEDTLVSNLEKIMATEFTNQFILVYVFHKCFILMDRYPRYDTDTHLGNRPPTPIQQREVCFTLNARRKKTEH